MLRVDVLLNGWECSSLSPCSICARERDGGRCGGSDWSLLSSAERSVARRANEGLAKGDEVVDETDWSLRPNANELD